MPGREAGREGGVREDVAAFGRKGQQQTRGAKRGSAPNLKRRLSQHRRFPPIYPRLPQPPPSLLRRPAFRRTGHLDVSQRTGRSLAPAAAEEALALALF